MNLRRILAHQWVQAVAMSRAPTWAGIWVWVSSFNSFICCRVLSYLVHYGSAVTTSLWDWRLQKTIHLLRVLFVKAWCLWYVRATWWEKQGWMSLERLCDQTRLLATDELVWHANFINISCTFTLGRIYTLRHRTYDIASSATAALCACFSASRRLLLLRRNCPIPWRIFSLCIV